MFPGSLTSNLLLLSVLVAVGNSTYSYYSDSYPGAIEAMSSDKSYAIFSNSNERNIYVNNGTAFKFLHSIGLSDPTNAMSRAYLLINPNIAIMTQYKINMGSCQRVLRMFNFSTDGLTPLLNIPFTTAQTSGDLDMNLYGSNVVILGASVQSIIILRWDNSLGTFVPDAGYAFTNPQNPRATAISADGRYFVQGSDTTTTFLYLYKYATGTYSVSDSYDFAPLLIADIQHIIIFKNTAGAYFMTVAIGPANAALDIFRFSISGTDTLSLLQHMTPTTNAPNTLYLSPRGSYFLSSISSPPTISLYQLNLTASPVSYIQISQKPIPYPISPTPGSYFLKDDKSYYYYTSATTTSTVNGFNLYFQCNVTSCVTCGFFGWCRTCAAGFLLKSGLCVCPDGYSLVAGSCVACNITLCASCSTVNTCTGCTKGYTLSSNTCLCPTTKTISLITGQCVSCNTTNCSRCDYPNICASSISSSSSSGSSGSGSTTAQITDTNITSLKTQLERVSGMVVFVVVAMVLVIVAMLAGFVYLVVKMRQARVDMGREDTMTPKVGEGEGNSSSIQNLNTSTTNLNLQPTNQTNPTQLKPQNSQSKIQIQQQLFLDDTNLQQMKPTNNGRRKKYRKEREKQPEIFVMEGDSKNQVMDAV